MPNSGSDHPKRNRDNGMEQNDMNGTPADRTPETGGCPCCGGKGSNKIVIAIWMALLLGGISWFAYSQQKRAAEADRLLNEAYMLYGQGNLDGSTDYLRQSAELGNVWAQLYYGERLKNGFCADRNMPEAVKWLRKAAKQHSPEAFYQLGVCYENGEGVERDLEEAEAWYRKAVNSGFGPLAQSALEQIEYKKKMSGAGTD